MVKFIFYFSLNFISLQVFSMFFFFSTFQVPNETLYFYMLIQTYIKEKQKESNLEGKKEVKT